MFASFVIFISLFSTLKRKIKYFLSNNKTGIKGIIASTVDRGIVCVLFGLAHRMLLKNPNLQLWALLAIEFLWIVSRYIYFSD